jgi:methylenetetrahydrofolate dehydrogenase (NADP+)/methenyltetrahydrofolate cyclohydrolase
MPTPTLLAAKPVLERKKAELLARVDAVKKKRGTPPGLSVVLVGEDPASQVYVRNKGLRAQEHGMKSDTHVLPASATPNEVRALVEKLNRDPKVDGILIQRPLPKTFIEEEVAYWVTPSKDVDAFHPENVGRLVLGLPCFAPCTPAGVMTLLQHYGIPVRGKTACVVGRSSIVGKPMASLLLQADATVLQAHSRTQDLPQVTRQADILVVAAGKKGLLGREHVKPGAVVVDVGMHRDPDGKLMGDVRFDEVAPHASAITPVPGGVGPMTILTLLENTVLSAERSLS